MFSGAQALPDSFAHAKYASTFEETLGDPKNAIDSIIRKLEPDNSTDESDVAELQQQLWDAYLLDVTIPQDTAFVEQFKPKSQRLVNSIKLLPKKRKAAALDGDSRQ